jgi:hypothetical protein
VSRFVNSRTSTQAYDEPLLVVCLCYLGGRAPRTLRPPILNPAPAPFMPKHTPRPAKTLVPGSANGRSKIQSP